jgi:ubiquinone biosynthesis protein
MPPDQAMLLKVFVSLEGAFKKLDPDFDIMVAIQPTLQELVTDQLSPRALGKRALKIATQYAELFADLPKEVRRGIYSVKTGNLKVRIELTQFDQVQRMVMRSARLLALASVTSAVVIGGALVMVFRQKPKE